MATHVFAVPASTATFTTPALWGFLEEIDVLNSSSASDAFTFYEILDNSMVTASRRGLATYTTAQTTLYYVAPRTYLSTPDGGGNSAWSPGKILIDGHRVQISHTSGNAYIVYIKLSPIPTGQY